MINNHVKAILFDLGGVLINLDYQKTIAAFESLGINNFQEIYSQAQQNHLFDDLETGKISSFHFINRLLDLLPQGCNPNQVVFAWNAMILDFPAHRLEFLQKLSQKYELYLLSNTNDLHMEKVRRELKKSSEMPLEHYFKTVFLSQEIKDRKPNASIFEHVSRTIGFPPEQILFVDDSIQHIESAQKLGYQVIHLTSELIEHPYFS
ncbi:MAG: HAD family phosphatase [Crocinitomicaceae bacterium]